MVMQEYPLVLRRNMLKDLGVKVHNIANLFSNGLRKKEKVYRERDTTNVARY